MASSPLFNTSLIRGCLLASVVSIATVVYTVVDSIQSERAMLNNEALYISTVILSTKSEEIPQIINALIPGNLLARSGYQITVYNKANIIYTSGNTPICEINCFTRAIIDMFGLKLEITEDINSDYMIAISGVATQLTIYRFMSSPSSIVAALTPFLLMFLSLYMISCNRKLPGSLSLLSNKVFDKDEDTVLTGTSDIESSFIDLEKRMSVRRIQSESILKNQISELMVRVVDEENAKEEKIALLNHVITSTASLASSQYKLLSNLKVMISNIRSRITNKEDQISVIEVERMVSSAIINNHRITEPHKMLTKVFEPTAADMIHISDEIMLSLNTLRILYGGVNIIYEEDPDIPSELFINSSLFRDLILGLVQVDVSAPHTSSIHVSIKYNYEGDGHLQIHVTSRCLYAIDQNDNDIDADTLAYLQESLNSIGGNLFCHLADGNTVRERVASIPAISTGNPSSLFKSSAMKMNGSYNPILVVGSENEAIRAVCNKLKKLSCSYSTISTLEAESCLYDSDIVIIIDGSLHDEAIRNLKLNCKIVISLENENYEKTLRYVQAIKEIDVALPLNVTYIRLATNIIEARNSVSRDIGNSAINHESNVTGLLSRMGRSTSLTIANDSEIENHPSMFTNSHLKSKNILVYCPDDDLMNSVLSTLRTIEVKYTSAKDENTLYSQAFRDNFDYVFICITEVSSKEMDIITKIRWSCHSKDVKFYLIGSDVSQIKDIEFINIFQSIMMFPVSAENIIAQLY